MHSRQLRFVSGEPLPNAVIRPDARRSSGRGSVVLALMLALMLACLAGLPNSALAQRTEEGRTGAAPAPASTQATAPDTVKPPITPRRAFLFSLLVPGYSQSVLGRHKAAALFLTFEAVAISMVRESSADLREARRGLGDSIVVSYADAAGNPQLQRLPPRFDQAYVRVRRSHVEDWTAVLIANHLFAGADAYVAANLWDLPGQLSLRAAPGRATVQASFSW